MARDFRTDARHHPPPRAPLPVKLGRPINLTAGLAYRFSRNLCIGMPRVAAIHLEGMSDGALKLWLKRANDIARSLHWTGTSSGLERQPDTLHEIEQIAYDDFLDAMSRFAEEDAAAIEQKREPRFWQMTDLPCTRDGHWLGFLSAVHRAEALLQARLLQKVQSADSWQAAAWLLERKFPRTYGRVAPTAGFADETDDAPQKQVVILPGKSDSAETWADMVAREQKKASA